MSGFLYALRGIHAQVGGVGGGGGGWGGVGGGGWGGGGGVGGGGGRGGWGGVKHRCYTSRCIHCFTYHLHISMPVAQGSSRVLTTAVRL